MRDPRGLYVIEALAPGVSRFVLEKMTAPPVIPEPPELHFTPGRGHPAWLYDEATNTYLNVKLWMDALLHERSPRKGKP